MLYSQRARLSANHGLRPFCVHAHSPRNSNDVQRLGPPLPRAAAARARARLGNHPQKPLFTGTVPRGSASSSPTPKPSSTRRRRLRLRCGRPPRRRTQHTNDEGARDGVHPPRAKRPGRSTGKRGRRAEWRASKKRPGASGKDTLRTRVNNGPRSARRHRLTD